MDHIWLDAAHNRDTGTMDWLFADNFVEIHPGGFIVNKKSSSIRSAIRTSFSPKSTLTIFKCATSRRMWPC